MTDPLGDLLTQALGPLSPQRLKIAFSGGVDSTALLLSARQQFTTGPLIAVHINHQIHPEADQWAEQCRELAATLKVEFQVHRLARHHLTETPNEGELREARYQLLARDMAVGDVMASAHHQDDVAESLLLAALRGGSPHELAGIAGQRPLGPGWLVRPWLTLPRAAMIRRVKDAGINWIEDPSNQSSEVRRSFLRQHVLPVLSQRWPEASGLLAATAQRQARAARVMDELLDAQIAQANAAGGPYQLDGKLLDTLSPATQLALLRRWLVNLRSTLPPASQLTEFLDQRERSATDRQPQLPLPPGSLRCYRRSIYWVSGSSQQPVTLVWSGHGQRPSVQLITAAQRPFEDGYVTRDGDDHRRKLSTVFQALGVPPWERQQLPLLVRSGNLVQVGDYWRSTAFSHLLASRGLSLHFSGDRPIK